MVISANTVDLLNHFKDNLARELAIKDPARLKFILVSKSLRQVKASFHLRRHVLKQLSKDLVYNAQFPHSLLCWLEAIVQRFEPARTSRHVESDIPKLLHVSCSL